MLSKLPPLRLTAGFFLCTLLVVVLFRFVPTVSSRSARLEQDLERKFLQHQTLQLDARTVSQQVRETGRLSLATSDLSFDLELVPHDLRAHGYRAEEFGAGGVARAIDIGPVRTFRGRARGSQGGSPLPQLGEARFTIDDNRIEGLIITPTEHYFVEPARKFSEAALTSDYVLYRESDVTTSSTGECGVTLSEQVNERADAVVNQHTQPVRQSVASGNTTLKQNFVTTTSTPTPIPDLAATSLLALQVATEADHEYVLSKGGPAAAAQEILNIMNQVGGLFEIQLGLTLKVSYQSVWSTSNQPYSSTNPSALLSELTNFWNANRGSVGRDVVHMWTAKNLENATIGTAYLEALCRYTGSGRAAYGLSKGVSGVQQIAITAHEFGHNLGATHPNQQVPPPAECNNTVMGSSVSTTPQLDFCEYSANEISNYLDTNTSCLNADASNFNFIVPRALPGTIPNQVAVGEFNGDGKQDFAVTRLGGIDVFLGSDNGNFVSTFSPGNGSSPAVGDFDRDGKQDIVLANSSSGTLTVLIGSGTGKFQAAGDYPVGQSPSRLVVADFNKDGKDDVAALRSTCCNGATGEVTVILGTGSGSFDGPRSYTAGVNTTDVLVGEFNQDNIPDLVVANFTSPALSFLFGVGDGSFQPPFKLTIFTSQPGIAVGDFDQDGVSDVAVARPDIPGDPPTFTVIILPGSGGIRFLPVRVRNPTSLTVGDFDGDGKDDLAVSGGTNDPGLDVIHSGGARAVSFNVRATGRLVTGDFNGDGYDDIIDTTTDSIVFGSSTGIQAPRKRTHIHPTALAVADFNRDGKQDLAVTNTWDRVFPTEPDAPSVRLLFGTGTGDFEEGFVFAATFSNADVFDLTDVVADDFNNDGRPDIAAVGRAGVLKVVLGASSGFQTPVSYPLPFGSAGAAPGDFNQDGKLDLVVTGNSGTAGEVRLMLGNGDGVFQAPVAVGTIRSSSSDVAAGDFNRDGKLDLVVAYDSVAPVSLLLGTGGGGFLPPVDISGGQRTLSVGDFNLDGKVDLALGGVSILLGDGNGGFGNPINLGGGGRSGLATGDFNDDGKPDLAAASGNLMPRNERNTGSITIMLNSTGNSFTAETNDNFAAARVIGGPIGNISGSTLLATKEVGEPNHASASNGTGGASIWYRWTAPATGKFYFQTFGSSFPSVIAIYTGTSVGALTLLAQSTSSVPEYVEINATDGVTYQIAIDGVTGDAGRTVLNWNTGSLTNDNFAFAREIRGSSGSVNGNNTTFTLEPNEPTLPGAINSGFSAWYRWTAPNTGKVTFSTTPCGDTTRLLGAYTGNFVDTLSLVAVNFDGYRDVDDPGICDNRTLRFNAVAGTSYRIQMRSVTGAPFTLRWNYADPPPNDNFANALILAGPSGTVAGTNRDATKEPGEANHAGGPGGASIWYRWTASATGQVTFDTIGFRNQSPNSFRYLTALMAVYTGASLTSLSEVVTNSTKNKVIFNATAGTTYHIAIDSAPYAGGGLLPGIVPLHWGTKQISNDDFVNAQPLAATGSFSPLLGSNAGATKETGEPNHQGSVGGTSVWYRWTALTDGNASFVFSTCTVCDLGAANAAIAVYTGGSVNSLTPVPTSFDNNHTFFATRGKTYFIAVDSRNGSGGTYEFSLVSSSISARNNDFNKAQVLSGNAGAVAGDNSGATREINEPDHANDKGGASVWYQWTAPASGLYTFDTFGSNFDTLLGVYTGNVVSALSTVASSDNAGSSTQSRITFDAKVNTTYFIAVDGKSIGIDQGNGLSPSQTGFIMLNWSNLPPPVNDNFSNAQTIQGLAGSVTGRNTVAGKEGGEPNHADNPGGASVWYRWTAPNSGKITFNTASSDFNTLLAVYTGDAVSALTPVSSSDDIGELTQSRVTFNAVAGTVYHISVDGSVGVPGNVTPLSGNLVLSWFPEVDGGNDNFAQAQTLTGTSGSVAGTNFGARKETGEPNHAGDRGGRSLWYSWTAPFSGPALLTTAGSDFDTQLAVYTGTNVNALSVVASNDDSPYPDNLGHVLSSSLTFTAVSGTTYKIAVDGSGGRFGNFVLRWGPEAKISGQVSFLGEACGSDKEVTMILRGEDARAVAFTGSGTYTFEHLRAGGNYSVRGVSQIAANCLPLFLERTKNLFPLAGDVLDANFVDDGLRGGGSTSNITGRVRNAAGVGLHNIAIALSGSASRTVYTDSAGQYQLPNLPAGTYQVTPSKAGAVFTPDRRTFTFAEGQSINDANFVTQDSYNISGQTRVQNGQPLADVTVTLSNGTQAVTVLSDNNGFYSFDAAAGGNYTLSAAKSGLTLAPVDRPFPQLGANQKNVDFTVTTSASTPSGQNVSVQLNGVTVTFSNVTGAGNTNITPISPGTAGTLPNGFQLTTNSLAFDVSTTATIQPPITVCFNVPSITNPMEFAQLRVLHSKAGVMVDRTSSHDFTAKTICATVDSLSAFVITSSIIQVLLDESGPGANQAAAVDAVLMFRDPFPLVNTANPFTVGSDRNTRVLIFLRNFKLAAGETPTAVMIILTDGSNQHHEIVAENVFSAPGFDFSQVRFRLPDTLAPGLCTIQVRAHEQITNVGTVRIKP